MEVEEVREERDGDGWVRCLDGARSCPPEDCGGTDGYVRLLEILFDPRHPEFDEMRHWVGRVCQVVEKCSARDLPAW